MPTHHERLAFRQNALGGQSLYILPGADLAALPAPFCELLSQDHARMFTRPKEAFLGLARESSLPGMRQWFTAMAAAGKCALQVHLAHVPGGTQSAVTARGLLPHGGSSYEFMVPSGIPTHGLPAPLESLYRVIDGTIEGIGFEAGGLVPRAQIRFDFTCYPIVPESCPVDLENPLDFYRAPNGDCLVAEGTRVFWFLHENCTFVQAGDLDEVVNSYFTAQVERTPWIAHPYGAL